MKKIPFFILCLIAICTSNCSAVTVLPGTEFQATNVTYTFATVSNFDGLVLTNETLAIKNGSWQNISILSPANLSVNISKWNGNTKIWNESANSSISVSHTITGFSQYRDIILYRDGTYYQSLKSSSDGALNWTYTGGFSSHSFSTKLNTDTASADDLNTNLLGPFALFAVGLTTFAGISLIAILKSGGNITTAAVEMGLAAIILAIFVLIIIAL